MAMDDEAVIAKLGRLVQLIARERQPDVQASLLEALLSSAFSLDLARVEQKRERSAPLARVVDGVVARATQLLRADLKRRWTVRELARAVGVSRAVLARRFVQALGEPPQRWLARERLERAATLLVASDDALAGVAAAVGYDSEFAFNRAFRRQFGVAPGAYRRHLRRAGGFGSSAPIMRAA
jgi:transcriptional regulator GlxA family with amidase domain